MMEKEVFQYGDKIQGRYHVRIEEKGLYFYKNKRRKADWAVLSTANQT